MEGYLFAIFVNVTLWGFLISYRLRTCIQLFSRIADALDVDDCDEDDDAA